MSRILQKFKLEFNPFESAATGPPVSGSLSPPEELTNRIQHLLDVHLTGQGVKPVVIVGEYGTGKTCLLQWLHREVLPDRQIKSFYFDNPGVQFYDLANALLRTIGRKDFAKFIWELAHAHVKIPYQQTLFSQDFESYLQSENQPGWRKSKSDITTPLQEALLSAEVTTDEETAYCLARIATEIVRKPYFEYRDFIPRQQGSVVPEGQEARYFRAILKTILKGTGARSIAFLVDEFEEIGLQKRLTRRAAHDYLVTLKRLIDLAQSEQVDFWVVLSMTQDAYETTAGLQPALIDRFSAQSSADNVLRINPLNSDEARELILLRLDGARSKDTDEPAGSLFPFPDNILDSTNPIFRPNTYSNPRRLVQTCFRAIGEADADVSVPFSESYLHRIEEEHSVSPTKQNGQS